MGTSTSEVNLSTVSERKVEAIDNSEPTFNKRNILVNRVVDMELFPVALFT